MFCVVHCTPICQWMRHGALFQCCDKRLAGTAVIYCADMMPDDVISIQERQLSSSKSIKQKYLLVFFILKRNYYLRYLLFWCISTNSCRLHLNIQVSQGSAVTYLRRGGRFYSRFFCSSSQSARNRAVARKLRDAAAVLFGLKFADNIHYNFKSSQASKARLQSSKHTGAKQNLTQNGHSGSFKVTCFGVSGKAIRNSSNTKYTNVSLIY